MIWEAPIIARLALLLLAFLTLSACGSESHPADKADSSAPARVAASFQRISNDPVANGERLSRVLGCRGCHGADLRGQDWFEDPAVGILYSSNLSLALPNYSDAQIERAVKRGIRGDGSALWDMPSHIFSRLSAADMTSLIAFLRTVAPGGEVHPPMSLGPEGLRLVAAGRLGPEADKVRETINMAPPAIAGDHDWARYMIRATCAECHGLDLAGDPNPSPESTAPPLSIVAAYSRPEFHHLLRTGEPVGGRRLGLMAMVARSRFSRLSGSEVDAIYDYLSALAAVPD